MPAGRGRTPPSFGAVSRRLRRRGCDVAKTVIGTIRSMREVRRAEADGIALRSPQAEAETTAFFENERGIGKNAVEGVRALRRRSWTSPSPSAAAQ